MFFKLHILSLANPPTIWNLLSRASCIFCQIPSSQFPETTNTHLKILGLDLRILGSRKLGVVLGGWGAWVIFSARRLETRLELEQGEDGGVQPVDLKGVFCSISLSLFMGSPRRLVQYAYTHTYTHIPYITLHSITFHSITLHYINYISLP